jgi:hypothetical protein
VGLGDKIVILTYTVETFAPPIQWYYETRTESRQNSYTESKSSQWTVYGGTNTASSSSAVSGESEGGGTSWMDSLGNGSTKSTSSGTNYYAAKNSYGGVTTVTRKGNGEDFTTANISGTTVSYSNYNNFMESTEGATASYSQSRGERSINLQTTTTEEIEEFIDVTSTTSFVFSDWYWYAYNATPPSSIHYDSTYTYEEWDENYNINKSTGTFVTDVFTTLTNEAASSTYTSSFLTYTSSIWNSYDYDATIYTVGQTVRTATITNVTFNSTVYQQLLFGRATIAVVQYDGEKMVVTTPSTGTSEIFIDPYLLTTATSTSWSKEWEEITCPVQSIGTTEIPSIKTITISLTNTYFSNKSVSIPVETRTLITYFLTPNSTTTITVNSYSVQFGGSETSTTQTYTITARSTTETTVEVNAIIGDKIKMQATPSSTTSFYQPGLLRNAVNKTSVTTPQALQFYLTRSTASNSANNAFTAWELGVSAFSVRSISTLGLAVTHAAAESPIVQNYISALGDAPDASVNKGYLAWSGNISPPIVLPTASISRNVRQLIPYPTSSYIEQYSDGEFFTDASKFSSITVNIKANKLEWTRSTSTTTSTDKGTISGSVELDAQISVKTIYTGTNIKKNLGGAFYNFAAIEYQIMAGTEVVSSMILYGGKHEIIINNSLHTFLFDKDTISTFSGSLASAHRYAPSPYLRIDSPPLLSIPL